MKKWLKRLFIAAAVCLVAAVGLLVCADVYCEWHGLPPAARAYCERLLLRRHGLPVQTRRIRMGLFAGVVAEGVVVRYGEPSRSALFEADEIRLSMTLADLLRGRLDRQSVRLHGAAFHLPPADGDAARSALPSVTDMDGLIRFRGNNVDIADVAANAGSIRLLMSATVSREGAAAGGSSGFRDLSAMIRRHAAEYRALAARLTATLRPQNFGGDNDLIRLHLRLPLGNLGETLVKGRVTFSDFLIRDVAVRQMDGTFEYSAGRFRAERLALMLSRDETVQGDVTVWPQRQLLQARLFGRLTAAAALRFAERPVPPWLRPLDVSVPLSFDAELAPSSYDTGEWKGDVAFTAAGSKWHGLTLDSVEGKLSLADEELSIHELSIVRGTGESRESVSGKAKVWLRDREIEGELTGKAYFMRRALESKLLLPPLISTLRLDGPPATATFALQRSPYAPGKWTGAGTFCLEQVSCGRWNAGRLEGRLSLEPGRLRVTDLQLAWSEGESEDMAGGLTVDFSGVEARDEVVSTFELTLASPAEPAATDSGESAPVSARGSTIGGTVTVRPQAQRVKAEIEGAVYPRRLYDAFSGPMSLPPARIVERISCLGQPARVSLSLPESGWRVSEWQVEGGIEAEDVLYDTLAIKTLNAQLHLTPKQIRFDRIRALTKDGATIELDVDLGLDPVVVLLRRGVVCGNPKLVEVFIENANARRIYLSVWKDFEWSSDSMPVIRLRQLDFRHDRQAKAWRLRMGSSLDVDEAVFRGIQTESVQLDVNLQLPGKVTVENIVVTRSDAHIEGAVRIRTEGLPSCSFEINGTADPRQVLKVINPEWLHCLDSFEFVPDSEISCHGAFFLARDPHLRLEGSLKAASCTYMNFPLENLAADWQISEAKIRWRRMQAILHGGAVDSTGYFDTASTSGLVAIRATDVELGSLLATLGVGGRDSAAEGKLSGNCRIQVLRDWSGMPLQLSGNGTVKITEGNIWQVPVFDQLGKLLKISSLGRISGLDADLDFKGDRAVVPRLTTDGTIVSLNGQGEYSWRSQRLHFRVHGEALKRLGRWKLPFKPLSWLLDAELTGTLQDHRWRLIGAFDRVLSGDGAAELKELKN